MSNDSVRITRSSVKGVTKVSNAYKLIENTCRVLANTGYFYSTQAQLRKDEVVKTPSAFVGIREIRPVAQVTNGRQEVEYQMVLGIADHNDSDAALLNALLSYAEEVRKAFSKKEDGTVGLLLFDEITGHFNTVVGSTPIEPIDILDNDVIIYNSGVNVVYSVFENVLE